MTLEQPGARSMARSGLTKLMEECAELIHEAAKKSAYLNTDQHPDGGAPMSERLEEEMGDVLAAIYFVREELGLCEQRINHRRLEKLKTYFYGYPDPAQ